MSFDNPEHLLLVNVIINKVSANLHDDHLIFISNDALDLVTLVYSINKVSFLIQNQNLIRLSFPLDVQLACEMGTANNE